jgi:hypothetical protein
MHSLRGRGSFQEYLIASVQHDYKLNFKNAVLEALSSIPLAEGGLMGWSMRRFICCSRRKCFGHGKIFDIYSIGCVRLMITEQK